jgi:APA family basic amino acid/polyamine antiporter
MWSQTISYFAVISFNTLSSVYIMQYAGIIPSSNPLVVGGVTLADPYLIAAGLTLAGIFAALNWFKLELSAWVQVSLVFILIITGFIWNGGSLFASSAFSLSYFTNYIPQGWVGFAVATGIMVTMYFGFECVAQMSEEGNYPKKKSWIPVVGSLLVAGSVYIITLTAMAGVAPDSYLSNTANVPAALVHYVLGNGAWATAGWWGIVLGGMACALACVDGFWLALSRLFYGLSRANTFPKVIGRLNSHHIPGVASLIIFCGVVPMIVFSGTNWIALLFIVMGIAIAVVYFGATLSFIQLRRKHPDWKRPFKVPGGITVGVLGVFGAGFCVFWSAMALTPGVPGSSVSDWTGWIILISYIIIGAILYVIMARNRKASGTQTVLKNPTE